MPSNIRVSGAQRVAHVTTAEPDGAPTLTQRRGRGGADGRPDRHGTCASVRRAGSAPDAHILPADDKHDARLIVSQIVVDTLANLDMAYPRTTARRHRELESFRSQL